MKKLQLINSPIRVLINILLIFNLHLTNSQTITNNVISETHYKYPLKVNRQTKRFLMDQDNRPFFWSGDAAWSLIAQASMEDAEFYLDNRMSKGFSVIMVNLIEHKFSSFAPANIYGHRPFTGRTFATPDEKYFGHADSVIREAEKRNIIVLLAPVYLGYGCGDEGWCSEIKNASLEDMRKWGRYLGNRYKNQGNIVWLIGGDTDPLVVREKLLEVVKGIQDFDTLHLFTAHNQPESMAVTPWQDEGWISVNNVYSYDSIIYRHYKDAYIFKPTMPYFLIESTYENEHKSNPLQIRTQAYRAILCGAMGHIFGNCPVWHFGSFGTWCSLTDWKSELNNSGSKDMENLQRLFRSRSWENLVPDFDHRVVTSGFGTWGQKDYVAAALTEDGSTAIAYLPMKCTVSVNMNTIKGKRARCWWFNPSEGRAEFIGTFSTSGTRKFTAAYEGDRVLVIDSYFASLPAPGSGPDSLK